MNLRNNRASLLIALTVLAVLVPMAHANVFTFVTPTGSSTGGGPVNATATVTTGAGTVTIVLTDLQSNPTDVAQLISDFDFVLSNGATTGTLSSAIGQEVTVAANGSFVLSGAGLPFTGWQLNSNVGGGIQITALGGGQPSDLIIGPPGGATYSNANNSIAGNGPHNPFVNQTGTFVVTVAGVTAATNITSAVFSFGTTAGVNIPGVPGSSVPEPTSLALGATMIGLTLLLGKRFRSVSPNC
jgi:hypothetical protein